MIKNSKCIVLNSMKFSETSKILTAYSEDYGKLSLIAKGAFSPKSKFLGLLETTYIVDLEFYFKENRDLHTLSNAEICFRYKNSKHELRVLACLMICCEIINKTQNFGEYNKDLFLDFENALKEIDKQFPLMNTLKLLVNVISYLGYKITLESEINLNSKIQFDLSRGLVNNYSGVLLHNETVMKLISILRENDIESEIELNQFVKIFNLLIRYTSIHLDKQININSLEILV